MNVHRPKFRDTKYGTVDIAFGFDMCMIVKTTVSFIYKHIRVTPSFWPCLSNSTINLAVLHN